MSSIKKIFITGGAGFIGSAFVRKAVAENYEVLNFDKLTYAADLSALESVTGKKNYQFVKGDICDDVALEKTILDFSPDAIVHFAAESHVDNSIHAPSEFINTNIIGTFNMLKIAKEYQTKKPGFRFVHISTDEVYGDLEIDEPKFTVLSRYKPSSPYASSKAASDHLVQAWHRTFGLTTLITHCSNNYGPYQNKEKFIPTVIRNAIKGNNIPVYGKGENIRDWIHVEDHVSALFQVMLKGKPGETYNIGGDHEMRNIDLANLICEELDKIQPRTDKKSYKSQITMVTDRLGHDKRYAIDNEHIEKNLGWKPSITFREGINQTIQWYIKKLG